jgi:fumigallin biosynthesis monooxygenase-like protein
MAEVAAGRYTAHMDEPFVVFLIGMRVNRLRLFSKWMPAARAMPEMLNVLYRYPEKGFLGGESFFRMFPITTLLLTYWRSFDDLEHFARSVDDPHLGAWKRFNQAVGQDGSVGIWHETYVIEAGQYEAVYGNMPVFGLAKATQHVPAIGRRLGGDNEPAVPTPEPTRTIQTM